jgi:hypothetical protein
MQNNKNNIVDLKALNTIDVVLYDDIQSLKRNINTDSFTYVDIASFNAWQESLQEWPLLAEWDAWSQR